MTEFQVNERVNVCKVKKSLWSFQPMWPLTLEQSDFLGKLELMVVAL